MTDTQSNGPDETEMGTHRTSFEKKPGMSSRFKAAPNWVNISIGAVLAVAVVMGGIMDEVASRAEAAEIKAANEAAVSGQALATSETTGEDDSAYKLRTGDCFRSKEAIQGGDFNEVEYVDCSESWDFVVLNSFALLDAEALPSADALTQEASARCDRNHSDYIHPTKAGWARGSRVVDCLMSRADFTPPAVGQCFKWDEADDVADVSCDTPHNLEAIHVTLYTGGKSYPGDDEIFRFADEVCFNALDSYSGTGHEGTTFSVFPTTPSAATWSALGDRTVTCYLLETDKPSQLVLSSG